MAVAPIRSALILVVTLVLAACGRAALRRRARPPRSAPRSGSRSTGPPTPTTPASTSRSRRGGSSQAGLDVEFVPYNNTPPDTLVGSGAAEFGISFQDSFTYAKASGVDAVSVMAIVQHWTSQIAVRADRADITQPARPRRQDLRRLRRRVRGAEDAGGDQGRGRRRAVPERGARHRGVRGALRRAGRLHRAVRDVGGHRGAAARAAAQDLRLHRLRLPRLLQRAAHRQRHLAAGAPGPGAGVRAGRAARLPSSPPTTRRRPPSCWRRRTRARSPSRSW